MRPRDWSPSVASDFGELFCGELIGSGIGRYVYVFELDPAKVLKVETLAGSFQNVIEWETWKNLRGTPYERYLAPCHSISPCGTVLVMSRVAPLTKKGEGIKLPSFLSDFKRENYGMLRNRVVCCDYGSNLLLNNGAFASRLRKPKWFTVETGEFFE